MEAAGALGAALGSALGAATSDPALPVLAVWAALAGLVRGFSGFGAALVFMPAAAAAVGPATAVAALFLFDVTGMALLAGWAIRTCDRTEVARLGLGVVIGVPLGVWALTAAEPTALRWGLCLASLAAFGAIAAGWRWTGPLPRGAEAAVGALSGFGGGVAGLSGVAPVLFYLGRAATAETLRANVAALFFVSFPLGGLLFWWNGLFTASAVGFGLTLAPLYMIAVRGGIALFPLASPIAFRRLAFGLVGASVVAGLPLWD